MIATALIDEMNRNEGAIEPAPERRVSDEVHARLTALDFDVHKFMRYHAKRRSFFDDCNNLNRAASAISAAGVIVSIAGGFYVAAIIAAALLAILSSVDLVVDFSRRGRVHDSLYRDFCELAANLEETRAFDEQDIRTFTARKLRIETTQPTAKGVQVVICANEILAGQGYNYKYRVRWWQRAFSHFFSLPPHDFPIVRSRISQDALQSA